MLNGLDLFSGIGGITEALMPWVRPVAYCENDSFAQAALLSRMGNGELPMAPIWDDVTTLGTPYLPRVDIIYGGFPCQDISVAGLNKGLGGERSGLFFEIARLAREIRATFLFLENVPAIRTRGLGAVIKTLAGIGYDCRWAMLSAAEVGAPHKRERWFLLACANGGHMWAGQNEKRRREGVPIFGDYGGQENVANAFESGLSWPDRKGLFGERPRGSSAGSHTWETEPAVGRVVDGLPLRRDRIKALGNAVVPQQARQAFKELMGLE